MNTTTSRRLGALPDGDIKAHAPQDEASDTEQLNIKACKRPLRFILRPPEFIDA
jgi:hypothetical protein